jgi:hypothetical protein
MPLFGKPITDLNTNQLRLLEWLEFYKAIAELEEKPPDDRWIKIDIIIDFWLQDFIHKRKKSNKYTRMGKKARNENTVKF